MAPRGFALQLRVVFVIVDVEARLGRVVDAPHYDRRDLDRIAALVVHLQPLAVEIARPQRELASRIERIGTAQTRDALAFLVRVFLVCIRHRLHERSHEDAAQ